jgi:uncharacterized protein with PIN domain
MRGYSSPASGSSPRGDASDHPEGVSKEASSNEEASGHPKINSPKILKTEKFEKSLPRVVVIKDYNEVDADAIIRTLKSIDIKDFGHITIDTATKDVCMDIGEDALVVRANSNGIEEILFNGEKLKTEEISKKLPKILKISEKDVEIIVDEEDIRVRINDAIIKILYNSSGLKEILIDDEVVYKKSTRKEIDFCPKCGSELVDTILDAVDNNNYDFIDDKLCIEVECPNCNHRFIEVWGWRGREEK